MLISTGNTSYGPLQKEFSFTLESDYSVLVGPNNAGKTAILQLAFRKIISEVPEVGANDICMILPERIFVEPSTETGGRTLINHNNDLVNKIRGAPLNYRTLEPPPQNELLRLLLTHNDFINQTTELKKILSRIDLPEITIGPAQTVTFEDVALITHGSGLRSLLPILAALTDPLIKVLLIDEPELSLEPKLQKALRDILQESTGSKKILISTHSHLFINRKDHGSNYLVTKSEGEVSALPLSSREELYDVVFNMLGNSVEDLFFPGNFLIVEGASDQVIIEKILELLEILPNKVKVVSATGVDSVRNVYQAINNTLLPLIMNDSPYANKVVALVDKPRDSDTGKTEEIKRNLEDRLFVLDKHSIEEYLPEDLFTKAGRDKNSDIETISQLKSTDKYLELRRIKKEISNSIASVLEKEDIEKVPVIKTAIEKAVPVI